MGHRVLVVDDDPLLRALEHDLLLAAGYRVDQATDAAEALKALHSGVDVLVSDLLMPGVDGLELLAIARRETPWVEAIIVTAVEDPDLALRCVRAGAVDFVSKAHLASQLVPAVQRALERRRLIGTAELYEACRALLEVPNREELPRRIVEVATRALGADRCQLWLTDDGGAVYLAHTHQDRDFIEDTEYRKTVERNVQRVASERSPLFFSDKVRVGEDKAVSNPTQSSKIKMLRRVRSSLFCPLLSAERAHGVLVASRVDVQRALGNHELHLAGVLASQAVLALELRQALHRALVAERFSVIGRLAAAVAHDVNNPIGYVLANVAYARDQLKGRADLAELVRALDDAQAGAERVREIARDIKELSNTSTPRSDRFALLGAVQSALRMCSLETASVGGVRIEIPAHLEVVGNQGQLNQVVMNLVANAAAAIKSSGRAGVLRVRAVEEGEAICLYVEDNGGGIAPEHVHRVFETFFTTKGDDGTGLGLALCRDIARAHGGDVLLHATSTSGTTFLLRVPMAPARKKAPAQAPLDALRRVLFVDDEPALLRAYVRCFGERFHVVTEQNPLAALELLKRERFDLVVCDVNMPTMTGPELLESLRRERPAAAERFVLATGSQPPPAERRFLCHVLAKPLDVSELEQCLAARAMG